MLPFSSTCPLTHLSSCSLVIIMNRRFPINVLLCFIFYRKCHFSQENFHFVENLIFLRENQIGIFPFDLDQATLKLSCLSNFLSLPWGSWWMLVMVFSLWRRTEVCNTRTIPPIHQEALKWLKMTFNIELTWNGFKSQTTSLYFPTISKGLILENMWMKDC